MFEVVAGASRLCQSLGVERKRGVEGRGEGLGGHRVLNVACFRSSVGPLFGVAPSMQGRQLGWHLDRGLSVGPHGCANRGTSGRTSHHLPPTPNFLNMTITSSHT